MDRPDNCQIYDAAKAGMMEAFNNVQTSKLGDLEEFLSFQGVMDNYHSIGHMVIATCASGGLQAKPHNIMANAEVSARDPIFWRWHKHIDQVYKQKKKELMGSYSKEDIGISGGITLGKISIECEENIPRNNLITYMEDARAQFTPESNYYYRRLNHKDFSYKISLHNARLETKKIIVRIFLALEAATQIDGVNWYSKMICFFTLT